MPINEKIYWANTNVSNNIGNSSGIFRANYDGTNEEIIIKYPELGLPSGIALNYKEQRFYWSDYIGKKIMSSDLDGTNKNVIINDGIDRISGLYFDEETQKLYWSDFGTKTIERSFADGSNRETIISTGIERPMDLAVSNKKFKIYWTDGDDGTINSADLDGKNPNTIYDIDSEITGFPSLYLDDENSILYFSEKNGATIYHRHSW